MRAGTVVSWQLPTTLEAAVVIAAMARNQFGKVIKKELRDALG
ncbi:hypothetical protein [Mycobacterium shigaense]|nr:hypothetical protein [Mycobacterium shigaense]MEA1124586.1 hypothetical protein [Mycobacterium shigaense]